MKSVNIKLNLMTDGAKFVQIVGAYPYDMDLRSGRHVVDAKSILGIFSLDWSKPVTMEIYSDDCDDLLAEIKPLDRKSTRLNSSHKHRSRMPSSA